MVSGFGIWGFRGCLHFHNLCFLAEEADPFDEGELVLSIDAGVCNDQIVRVLVSKSNSE